MFVVFYTVKIVYICVFTTCSTSYCLTDPWNVWDFHIVPTPAALLHKVYRNFLLTLHSRISVIQSVKQNVTGITKPRANAESITSPSHFAAENLTKNDLLIFYGGTKDISRNEVSNGLKALKAFAHRTTDTNVILLEAPHRYDLPPSSCVNTEVNCFNKRLHSLATTFNHVKVLSIPIERRFHTNLRLHLNQRGKYWIASNLVKEIRNPHLPSKSTPPIRLPWKDIHENANQPALGNQDASASSYDVQQCPSPVSKNDNSQKLGEGAESCNVEDPQEDETLHRSNRVKKPPTNKYQDFLCQIKSID